MCTHIGGVWASAWQGRVHIPVFRVKSKLRPACLTARNFVSRSTSVNVSCICNVNVKYPIGLNLDMPDLCSPEDNPSLVVFSMCLVGVL